MIERNKTNENDSYYDELVYDTYYDSNTLEDNDEEYYSDYLEENSSYDYESEAYDYMDNLDDLESDYYSGEAFRGLMDEDFINEDIEDDTDEDIELSTIPIVDDEDIDNNTELE